MAADAGRVFVWCWTPVRRRARLRSFLCGIRILDRQWFQLVNNFRDDRVGSLVDFYGDGVRGLFQVFELTFKYRVGSKVSSTGVQSLLDELVIAFQVDETNAIGTQGVAILAFERRTSQDRILPFRIPLQDGVAQGCQPGSAVGIIKRNAAPNLLDVRSGMKIVGVGEVPTQLLREEAAHSRLACANNAHNNHDHSPLNIT